MRYQKQSAVQPDHSQEFFEFESDKESKAEGLQSPTQSPFKPALEAEVWSLQLRLYHCSISLLQSDKARIPENWELSPVHLPTSDTKGVQKPVIAGIAGDHLQLTLDHINVTATQWTQRNSAKVSIGTVKLHEYLMMDGQFFCHSVLSFNTSALGKKTR